MRSEENPLDLNNLPEDYNRDGKEDTSSYAGGYRKKKSGAKDGKDDGKVYECRFCSLKFCKSQALGGHMNRHRQERETEALNQARQLVFNTDSLLGQGPLPHLHHLGGQPFPPGGYHHHHHPTGNLADPSMHFRSNYPPTRLFSDSSSTATATPTLLPPPQPYMYPSPTRVLPLPTSHYPATTDYILGHAVPTNTTTANAESCQSPNNFTCIGAPANIGPRGITSIGNNYDLEVGGGRGLSWGGRRSCTAAGGGGGATTTQLQLKNRLDSTLINRFQDGF